MVNQARGNVQRVSAAHLAAAVCSYLLVSGCTSDAPRSASSTVTKSAAQATQQTTAVLDPDQARRAVVRIAHDSDFFHPAWKVGSFLPKSGSGFVLDSTGLIVTSSALTAGRDSVRVFVGDSTESRTAAVVGRSVCDGVSLIALDGASSSYLPLAGGSAGGPGTVIGSTTDGSLAVTGVNIPATSAAVRDPNHGRESGAQVRRNTGRGKRWRPGA